MTHEDHEEEQDEYLRSLAERTRVAEEEAQKALLTIADCHDQNRSLLAISAMSVLTGLILAAIVAYFVYGH